jgi:hypothetical protein
LQNIVLGYVVRADHQEDDMRHWIERGRRDQWKELRDLPTAV